MICTVFFQCDRCHVECRIDSEAPEPGATPLVIRHCPDSEGIPIPGKVTRFQNGVGVCGWMFSIGLMQPTVALRICSGHCNCAAFAVFRYNNPTASDNLTVFHDIESQNMLVDYSV